MSHVTTCLHASTPGCPLKFLLFLPMLPLFPNTEPEHFDDLGFHVSLMLRLLSSLFFPSKDLILFCLFFLLSVTWLGNSSLHFSCIHLHLNACYTSVFKRISTSAILLKHFQSLVFVGSNDFSDWPSLILPCRPTYRCIISVSTYLNVFYINSL